MAKDKIIEAETIEKVKAPKKKVTLSFEVPEAFANKFSAKCVEIKIDEKEALELLLKGFIKDKFKFETETIVKHSI